MENVRKNKIFLIKTLSADARICLQYVQNHNIITQRDYNNLNQDNIAQENIIINLLDTVTSRGEETCREFMKLLKDKKFQENFPQLKKLFTPDSEAPVQAPAEVIRIQTVGASGANLVDKHREMLIQRISSVMEIADCLRSKKIITDEMYSSIRAAATPQYQMRNLYECLDSGGRDAKEEFYNILRQKNPYLVKDLK